MTTPVTDQVTEQLEQAQRPTVSSYAEKWFSFSPQMMKERAAMVRDDLIDGLLPSSGVTMLAGGPGVGKSFTCLSQAAAVATGSDWFGQKGSGTPKNVIYVLGEGAPRFGQRIAAFETDSGEPFPETVRFINGREVDIDLCNLDDINGAIELMKAYNARVDLIIFDTLSVLSSIEDENAQAEPKKVLKNLEYLSRALDTAILVVHHTAKTGKVRGSTLLRGNVDCVVMAIPYEKNQEDYFALSTRISDDGKSRYDEPIYLRGFQIAAPGVIALASGEDDDGMFDGIEPVREESPSQVSQMLQAFAAKKESESETSAEETEPPSDEVRDEASQTSTPE